MANTANPCEVGNVPIHVKADTRIRLKNMKVRMNMRNYSEAIDELIRRDDAHSEADDTMTEKDPKE